MSRIVVGALFLTAGSFLYATRFLNAVLYAVAFGTMGHVSETANKMAPGVLFLSVIFFILGIIYLVWGEVEEHKKSK